MSRLFICHTPYHVFVTLLKRFADPGSDGVALVTTIPGARKLAEAIRDEGVYEDVHLVDRERVFSASASYHVNWAYTRLFSESIDKKLDFLRAYDEFFLFNDYSEIGAYLNLRGFKYHLLEDGCNCFQLVDFRKARGRARAIKRFARDALGVPCGLAWGDNVIDVEVNDANNLKTSFSCPIIELRRSELMAAPTSEQVALMFRVFRADGLRGIPSGSTIVLTQPLAEIGVVRRPNQTIELFRRLCLKCGSPCYIKPHPRDVGDYDGCFPSDRVIDKNLPIELLNYLHDEQVGTAITYSSTSIYQVNAQRKIVLCAEAKTSADVEFVPLDEALKHGIR